MLVLIKPRTKKEPKHAKLPATCLGQYRTASGNGELAFSSVWAGKIGLDWKPMKSGLKVKKPAYGRLLVD
jgi:hypothetical protein